MSGRRGMLIRAVSIVIIGGLRVHTAVTGRPRVRVFVTNEFGEVLLLRGVVGHGFWSFPGGGVGRNEPLVRAAVRELEEETGIKVKEPDLEYVRQLERPDVDIPFKAPLYRVTVKKTSLPVKLYNPREIIEVGWFAMEQLPSPLSAIARAILR